MQNFKIIFPRKKGKKVEIGRRGAPVATLLMKSQNPKSAKGAIKFYHPDKPSKWVWLANFFKGVCKTNLGANWQKGCNFTAHLLMKNQTPEA